MRAPWRGLLFSLFFFFFATGERTRTTHHPTRAPFLIVLQPAAIFSARGDHRGRWACVLLDVLSATAKSTRDAAEDGGSLSFFGVVGGGKHTYSDKALLYTFRPQNKGQGTVWWLPAVEARACSARAHTHTNKQRARASAVTCVGTHCALAAVLPPFFTTGPPPNETATKPESAYFCETQTPREGKTVSGKKSDALSRLIARPSSCPAAPQLPSFTQMASAAVLHTLPVCVKPCRRCRRHY